MTQLDPATVARIAGRVRPLIERQLPTGYECLDLALCAASHPMHGVQHPDGTVHVEADLDGLLYRVVRAIWEEHLIYLSTGCLHGEHGHCCNNVSSQGEPKWAGHCKFCSAACLCPCHPAPQLTPDGETVPA